MKSLKKHIDLIILTTLWIVSVYSIISFIIYSYDVSIKNYLAFGLLLIISILRYFKIKRAKTMLALLLVFGSVNAIQFTYSAVTFVISWTPLGNRFSIFKVEPLSFSLLILLFIFNLSDFMKLLNDLFSDDPQKAEVRKRKISERQNLIISSHIRVLEKEKDSFLQEIIENKSKYQIEYIKAAQKVVYDRENSI